jgi:hypothetical protein
MLLRYALHLDFVQSLEGKMLPHVAYISAVAAILYLMQVIRLDAEQTWPRYRQASAETMDADPNVLN